MTELQDRILDRLAGKPVGRNWPNGPLALAADVTGGTTPVKFGQTDMDRGAKNEIARRLGYPILLCEAIQGANRGAPTEDDRRSLAMILFSTILIGGRIPRIPALEQNRIALRMAFRVHPFACTHPKCRVAKTLSELLVIPTITSALAAAALQVPCAAQNERRQKTRGGAGSIASSDLLVRLRHTSMMALRGFETAKSVNGWCSVRESARLAAAQRGIPEAVAGCVEIARLCGMSV